MDSAVDLYSYPAMRYLQDGRLLLARNALNPGYEVVRSATYYCSTQRVHALTGDIDDAIPLRPAAATSELAYNHSETTAHHSY